MARGTKTDRKTNKDRTRDPELKNERGGTQGRLAGALRVIAIGNGGTVIPSKDKGHGGREGQMEMTQAEREQGSGGEEMGGEVDIKER